MESDSSEPVSWKPAPRVATAHSVFGYPTREAPPSPRLYLQSIKPRRRVVDNLAPAIVWKATKGLVDKLARARPRRCRVRIVGGPHDVVRAVAMQPVDEHRLIDKSRIHLALDIFARLELKVHISNRSAAIVNPVHPPHQIRHPADVVFSRDNLESRKAFQHFAEHKDRNRSLHLMVKRGAPLQAIRAEEINPDALAARQDMQ